MVAGCPVPVAWGCIPACIWIKAGVCGVEGHFAVPVSAEFTTMSLLMYITGPEQHTRSHCRGRGAGSVLGNFVEA